MEEFVKVIFPTRRKVWVDGNDAGYTNKVFQVETGEHTFDLGTTKKNYTPSKRNKKVVGTKPDNPMLITFTRTDA